MQEEIRKNQEEFCTRQENGDGSNGRGTREGTLGHHGQALNAGGTGERMASW